jgi:hypothetical protein
MSGLCTCLQVAQLDPLGFYHSKAARLMGSGHTFLTICFTGLLSLILG